jgi:hypothetical protein
MLHIQSLLNTEPHLCARLLMMTPLSGVPSADIGGVGRGATDFAQWTGVAIKEKDSAADEEHV